MNLGGASNVDLTEAARLMKQSAGGAGVPNQQVPPPMMLMQQAVAMQQFQFQQALLMQQVMATQQAAARAATVKSAQEMASARAAEISKQLKGNDPDVEEEKKSPVRSRSRTPSHSRSRSFSRSKSRSPLRYRRDRSASRSPIRYRRDSRPSPSRSRDYYGYRGRSRRGFYRGRGEYAWNPSFRRDWERDRDHYSSRSRRSRSHSRSRVRRRSHTRSRSPRGRRDRSVTPPRYHHEDRRSGRSSRRSKSIEAEASPSHSSRSRSESLHKEDTSRSPPSKSRDRVSGKDSRKEEKLSPEPMNGVRALIRSPAKKDYREKVHQDDDASSKGKEATEDMKVQMKGRDELSVSPARSLSVSLSPPPRSRETNMDILEDVNGLSDRKKNAVQDTVGERTNEGLSVAADVAWKKLSLPAMVIEGAVSDAEASLEPETDVKGVTKGKTVDFGVKGRYVRKESGRSEFPSDESDGDKEVDDWRDDIKANELEKIKRMENKRELERREEERKAIPVQPIVVEDVRDYGVTLLEHLGKGRKAPVQKALDSELLDDHDVLEKTRKDALSKQYTHVETVHSLEDHLNGSKVVIKKEEMQQRGYMGHGGRDRGVKEEMGGIIKEINPESTDVAERDEDDDVVFEGPKLAYEEVSAAQVTELYEKGDDFLQDVGREIHNSLNEEDSAEEMGAELPPSLMEVEEVGVQKGKDKGRLRDEEEVRGTNRGKSRMREEDELYSGSKVKEKSRSRERSRRHEDEGDRERRKEKHRKHKRRHQRDEETEKEDDDEDDKRDGDGGKDKEERRHRSSKKHRSGREHNDEKRDKRKRRHKHRGKSPSESSEKEVLVGEIEGAADVDQMVGPVLKRHTSSRENRRKDVSKSPTHASGSASE